MEIVSRQEIPGLASLYLARLRADPSSLIEFVDTLEPGVPKGEKWVMMVSTQLGCPVGCSFCDAGALGYRGNLTAEEILDQIRFMADAAPPQISLSRHPKVKIHFARMGEPSLNPAVLEALLFLGLNLKSPGLIPSISTVAPQSPVTAAFFEQLLDIKDDHYPDGRFQLQFSVHSTSLVGRHETIPVKIWSLEELADYGSRFVKIGDRKITLNFALSREAEFDPAAVAGIFPPDKFLIKFTPVNPTETSERNAQTHLWLKPPAKVARSQALLKSLGYQVIVSPSLPEEIRAATSCGQLWSQALKEQGRVLRKNRIKEAQCYVSAQTLKEKGCAWLRRTAPYARSHPAFPLSPEKNALLIVDMQEFFLDPQSPAYLPPARAVLSNVRRLAEGFRRAGRPVFFALHAHEDPARDGGLMSLWWKKVCLAGTPQANISRLLEPESAMVFRKCRYSAFSNPDLERALRLKGIEELVVAGIVTNLCVESTVRDAFDMGFKTFVAADATAAHSEQLHLASLISLAQGFAAIRSTDDLLEISKTLAA